MTKTLDAGSTFPDITLPTAGGGDLKLNDKPENARLVVVYRGAHCPICKTYLTKLEELKPEFENIGVEVVVVSGDPVEKALSFREELGLTVPVAYDLKIEEMRRLGLYVSTPRSPQETDRPFPEPGLFVINRDGNVQIVDISNAPFTRPDLEGVLRGIRIILEKDYPVRGTA